MRIELGDTVQVLDSVNVSIIGKYGRVVEIRDNMVGLVFIDVIFMSMVYTDSVKLIFKFINVIHDLVIDCMRANYLPKPTFKYYGANYVDVNWFGEAPNYFPIIGRGDKETQEKIKLALIDRLVNYEGYYEFKFNNQELFTLSIRPLP
jgi:hypothetical protein